MKMLAKETAVFVPIAVLWVVLSIELEKIFFQDLSKHFKQVTCSHYPRFVAYLPRLVTSTET